MHDTLHPHFPLSYILSIAGFIAVFFVEKVLFAGHHHGGPYHNLDETKSHSADSKYGVLDEAQQERIPNTQ